MTQVTVVINGKSYRVACDDGQESHLLALAALVDSRVTELVSSIGQIDHTRLLVMASLLIADELGDAQGESAHLKEELRRTKDLPPPTPPTLSPAETDKLCEGIEKLAGRIEVIADRLIAS
ncbi:MAG: cell division protein ZapA [Alphaproteobacteria bacterium]